MHTVKFLRHHGFDYRHESYGRHGMVSWMGAVDALQVPWGAPVDRRHPTLHVVRCPLHVVGSICAAVLYEHDRTPFLKFVRKYVSLPTTNELAIAAHFWTTWNKLARSTHPEHVCRVDVPGELDQLLDHVRAHQRPQAGVSGLMPGTRTNHRQDYTVPTMADIGPTLPGWALDDFIETARFYGYKLETE